MSIETCVTHSDTVKIKPGFTLGDRDRTVKVGESVRKKKTVLLSELEYVCSPEFKMNETKFPHELIRQRLITFKRTKTDICQGLFRRKDNCYTPEH